MTYYEDLSPYEYVSESIPDGVTAVNVGWLEAGHEFPQGSIPEDFIEALSSAIKSDRQMQMRGWHRCQLPHINGEEAYPITVKIDGQRISLGGAEVRVISGSGKWMIAPDMILHYIKDHFYTPPAEFIEAVTRKSIAPHS